MWEELVEILADHPARWMIWEGQPLAETVEKLEAMGVGSVVFEPCGNRPPQGDYLTVMARNLDSLESVVSE